MSEESNFDAPGKPPIDPGFTPPEEDAVSDGGRKWIIPVVALGCGCVCLPLIVILSVLFGLGTSVQRLYKSTGSYQVYQLASTEIEASDEVAEVLGSPVETGWTSHVQESYPANEAGQVCIRFNVAGEDRNGSVYAEAQNEQGAWQLYQLTVSVNGEPEPLTLVPVPTERSPLCPEFDESEPDSEPSAEEPPVI
ncbi:MAG: cytochrome c oxidase assembly factor Coa1 family protein [Leptolyngbyaceae cyanobacterium]